MELSGKIDCITVENNNGNDKKVVTLVNGREILFVEFQGKNIQLLDEYHTGDDVTVQVRFNGKVSGLGRKYNNIIAKRIALIAN
ncbi:hypothetical protein NBRC110019_20370 [Neptunitalea chrysea]|uniref:Uncharacterized protein n=1 Tax=Neptunitalea chrysea TaxID=1647581 RepID=A0A9W6B719_9FLAO|nr:hypothetical protein [Neptunitalea chrysea]GLB52997.1 hypothetical protein NBRC110019_20370 [Neptunitalea chrysea]